MKERSYNYRESRFVDTFSSMSELMNTLPARSNYSIHIDRSHQSKVKVFAPHGGCIEPCTEPIAMAIGRDMLDCFVFSGTRKKDCFKTLHVSSIHYDEPRCMEMAREAEVAISLHGCDGEESFIVVGGSNKTFSSNLLSHLIDSGYSASPAVAEMAGRDERNFINQARRGGVQLELSAGFRRKLFPGFPKSIQRHPKEFARFVESMQSWICDIDHALTS